MKKIKVTLFLAILGLLFASCKTDLIQPVVSSSPSSPGQVNLTYTGTFDINSADSLMTFSWSASSFGFEASITYTVQLSSTSDFSSNVKDLFSINNNTSGTAKVNDVNSLLLRLGYAFGTPDTVYYRVSASVSSKVGSAYSEIVSTELTPYEDVPVYPMIYVPGAYQGWAPGDVNGRLFSYNSDSKYEGIIRIDSTASNNGEFKIAPAPNWDNSWGGALTASGNDYSGTLDPSGGNYVVTPATYKFTVDVGALTITLTKTDDWGIIGSSIPPYDWSADVNMFYNGQRKMWEITGDFKAGEFKFRANDAWDLNYGGSDGTLTAGGANIQLASDGNYTIRFDPVALTYTITQN